MDVKPYESNKFYYNTLSGNILKLGKSNSGKTSLVQSWALMDCFEPAQKVFWVSALALDKRRQYEINSCFSAEVVFVHTPTSADIDNAVRYFTNMKYESSNAKDSTVDSGNESDNTDSNSDDNSDSDTEISNYNHDNEINIGEKTVIKYLVVFDDVSEVADRSSPFLTFF